MSAEAKSVTRQLENGRAFAAARGWYVASEFVDDAISGAEFERRPGFQAMLAAASRGAFSLLVVSERKTLGREMSEVPYVIKRLARAGVEVWAYMDARCLTPRTIADKLTGAVEAFSDEHYRVATAQRVHEGHLRHVRAGHVVGGRLYGYTNRNVYGGEDGHGRPLKSHVERVVNPAEAEVVRRIFKLYAEGASYQAIAKALMLEGVPGPGMASRGRRELGGGWAPTTVRSILEHTAYLGALEWNAIKKRDDWGQVKPTRRDASEVVRVVDEKLRIVPDALWAAVQARRRSTLANYTGRPPKAGPPALLVGLASCGVCAGGLVRVRGSVNQGRYSNGQPRPLRPAVDYYWCGRHRRNGGHACANAMRLEVGATDEAVLRAVEEHVLRPGRVEEFLLDEAEARPAAAGLEAEARDLQQRAARLMAAIEAAGDVAVLAARLREVEARRAEVAVALARKAAPHLPARVVSSRLNEWRRRLRGGQARSVLQRVLAGRLRFDPLPEVGASFEAPTRWGRPVVGVVVRVALEAPAFVRPGDVRGREGVREAEAALERVYEQVLRRVRN